jgi:hypothetical protein
MPDLKLGKLPDRTPVKITITVSPDLNLALGEYAEVYRSAYGEAETIAELIPFMLGAFLDSDRGFAKARRTGQLDGRADGIAPRTPSTRRPRGGASSPSDAN